MASSFRFNAQKVFLTYAQTKAKMHPDYLLNNISAKAEIKDYLIAQERHKDGGYHLHAYFKFQKKLDIKNTEFFDLNYYRKAYHPNIQKPREVHKLWRYIKKDKLFITNIDETRPRWLVLIEESSTHDEFLRSLMWEINRIDNYSGYRTFRDLWDEVRNQKMKKFTTGKSVTEILGYNSHNLNNIKKQN